MARTSAALESGAGGAAIASHSSTFGEDQAHETSRVFLEFVNISIAAKASGHSLVKPDGP